MSYPNETLVRFAHRDVEQWLINAAGKAPERAKEMVSVLTPLGETILNQSWDSLLRLAIGTDEEALRCLEIRNASREAFAKVPQPQIVAGLITAPLGFADVNPNEWLETLKKLTEAPVGTQPFPSDIGESMPAILKREKT